MTHVAIAWLLTRPGVASVLLGARTPAQLADTLSAATLTLTHDDLTELGRVSAPGLPDYPYGTLEAYSDMQVWDTLGTARTP
jgi:aryl-alcohol dehydrogenase-like predicted oxidoreductase